ncbi:MAG: hypothetical protein ACREPG_11820 [Candidatus Binatia bacterium]
MFNVQRHIGRMWPFERVCMQIPVAFRKILYAACGLIAFSNAYAACKPDGPRLTQEMVANFLDKPEIILGNDASSKRAANAFSASITQYAAADQATIRALKSILPSATLQQRVAIGQGLYAAVLFCRPIDPAIATRIENGVRLIGNQDVILAYRSAENLSDPPGNIAKPNTLSGFKPVKPPAISPALIGKPTPANPGSLDLKLGDPFGLP